MAQSGTPGWRPEAYSVSTVLSPIWFNCVWSLIKTLDNFTSYLQFMALSQRLHPDLIFFICSFLVCIERFVFLPGSDLFLDVPLILSHWSSFSFKRAFVVGRRVLLHHPSILCTVLVAILWICVCCQSSNARIMAWGSSFHSCLCFIDGLTVAWTARWVVEVPWLCRAYKFFAWKLLSVVGDHIQFSGITYLEKWDLVLQLDDSSPGSIRIIHPQSNGCIIMVSLGWHGMVLLH